MPGGFRSIGAVGYTELPFQSLIGTVDPAARNGLIAEISPLATSTFALRANRPLADDGTLHLSISQPLRVEHGRGLLSVPVGRTKAGEVVRRKVSAGLAPSGWQIDVAAQWHRMVSAGELRLGAVLTRHAGHRATGSLDLTLLSGWRWAF